METGRRKTVLEDTLLEILARLPLRTIARFKSVCKTWKSVIESAYFRRLFVSLHQNSSSSWSLMFETPSCHPITEAIGFHGCETWDLPKSLGSYILSFEGYPDHSALDYFYLDSSNGLIWIEVVVDRTKNMGQSYKYLVGNPVLQEWVEIPLPPEQCYCTGLVTRVENGFLSSFKVVKTCHIGDSDRYEWRVYVYSSESGLWTFKRLLSSHPVDYDFSYCSSMNLNGMLYMWIRGLDPTGHGVLIAYDFYGSEADDQCRVIPLPLPYSEDVRRCLTTSRGDVIYIEILDRRLKVWRLNNNNNNSESNECWQLSREEITVGFDVDCIPMAMNPFDSDIVYLWSLQHNCLVSGNLQTQKFIVHQELENWRSSEGCYQLNTHDSKGCMEDNDDVTNVFMLSQFVLPQWMESVPRPPN